MLKPMIPQPSSGPSSRWLGAQNSLPTAKAYLGLSTGFQPLKSKWCWSCAPLQPRSKEWPSWGVVFASNMDRAWMCGQESHTVHVRWSLDRRGERREAPREASPLCPVTFWQGSLIHILPSLSFSRYVCQVRGEIVLISLLLVTYNF